MLCLAKRSNFSVKGGIMSEVTVSTKELLERIEAGNVQSRTVKVPVPKFEGQTVQIRSADKKSSLSKNSQTVSNKSGASSEENS